MSEQPPEGDRDPDVPLSGTKPPTRDEGVTSRYALNHGQYQAADVLAYLLSGIVLGGLAGWAGDRWLGTSFLLPIGFISGVCLGLYVVLIRYGRN